jgi:hypothetical protein
MAFKVAAPYTIFVPHPIPLHTTTDGDAEPQTAYEFYPDYWADL